MGPTRGQCQRQGGRLWLCAGFGEVLTRKYIATISWFSMLSLFLKGTRTPLETTDKIVSYISPPT